MKQAFVFPGQGSQFVGMARYWYELEATKKMLLTANKILGFSITNIMFGGPEDKLKETYVTQPAIFLHSVMAFLGHKKKGMDMVAGHSLGEFSALVCNAVLDFETALSLVKVRSEVMQEVCEKNPSAMAAVLSLEDEKVTEICKGIKEEIVVPANFNCPGQVVISGTIKGVELASEKLKMAGAKRVIVLPVRGAFHSPLMESAKEKLATVVDKVNFQVPVCPIYQNITAAPVTDATAIKKNLIEQLTGPVRWTSSVQAMITDGATHFVEIGPGKVLQGLIAKIDAKVSKEGFG